jgi:hypothetical protein
MTVIPLDGLSRMGDHVALRIVRNFSGERSHGDGAAWRSRRDPARLYVL